MYCKPGLSFWLHVYCVYLYLQRVVDAYQRYGVASMVTGKRPKHAARGRASRTTYRYRGWGESRRSGLWSASDVVANLRAERAAITARALLAA